jgi:hypothetical protein
MVHDSWILALAYKIARSREGLVLHLPASSSKEASACAPPPHLLIQLPYTVPSCSHNFSIHTKDSLVV